MTQIAHARSFDGVDDKIQLASTGLVSAPGPFTAAYIARLNEDPTATKTVIALEGGSGDQWSAGYRADENIELWASPLGAQAISNATFFTQAMGWCLIALARPDGAAATVRFHRYRYDTDTWTHEDDSVTVADMGTPAGSPSLWLGSFAAAEFASVDLAVAGIWLTTQLSDGEIESLADAISGWDALSPSACWLLNQAFVSTPVSDRVGDADQTAITGTTTLAVSDLPFDVGGVGPVATIIFPPHVVG